MSTIKILAGDIPAQKAKLQIRMGKPWIIGESVSIDLNRYLSSAEPLTEEKVKKLSGTAAWGFVGAVALGPLGAIGGMLIGGNKQRVTFVAELKDGRRFMAETDGKTWQKLQIVAFA